MLTNGDKLIDIKLNLNRVISHFKHVCSSAYSLQLKAYYKSSLSQYEWGVCMCHISMA